MACARTHTHTRPSSVLTQIQLWLLWCHRSLGEEAVPSLSLSLMPDTLLCSLCTYGRVWIEGWVWICARGQDCKSVDESRQANTDKDSPMRVTSNKDAQRFPSLKRTTALSAHDLEIIYPQFELNCPDWPDGVPAARRVPCLGAVHVWRRDREAGCIGLERRTAFREDESHARGQAGVKWGVRPAERPPAHALYSPTQLVSVIWGVCEGGGRAVGGQGCEGWRERRLRWQKGRVCSSARFEGIGGGAADLKGHMVQRKRALFHATHAQSLTSRSAVSHHKKGHSYNYAFAANVNNNNNNWGRQSSRQSTNQS